MADTGERGLTFFSDMNKDLSVTPEDQQALAAFKRKGMQEESKGLPLLMPRVEIIHGSTAAFRIKDSGELITGNVGFLGIVINIEAQRAWWQHRFGTPGSKQGDGWPDCFSRDLAFPDNDAKMIQAKACGQCPHDKFGSDVLATGERGRGKACKEMRRIFFMMEGKYHPFWMIVPPTSLRSMRGYIDKLKEKGIARPQLALTKFTCRTVQNADSVNYTEMVMDPIQAAPNNVAVMAMKLKDEIDRTLQTAAPVMQGELSGESAA